VTYSGFPEGAVVEAASALALSIGADVPPEDYAEAALLFLQELTSGGFVLGPLAGEVPRTDSRDRDQYSGSVPLAFLKAAHLREKTPI
jgi:hypothetical protein